MSKDIIIKIRHSAKTIKELLLLTAVFIIFADIIFIFFK